MRITYDPDKRAETIERNGLDFANAAEVFAGEYTQALDERYDYGEPRYIAAGYLRGRMVVLVWTPRGDTRRIISMRYCHEKEEKRWRAAFKKGG